MRGSLALAETYSDVAETEPEHLDVIVVVGENRLGTGGHYVPAFAVLVEVEILAPLNQVVDFVVKVVVAHLRVLLIVEGVFVERFKLLLETLGLHSSLIYCVTLLSNQLCILGISVQFSEPSNLTVPSLLCSLLLAHLGLKVELLGFL